MVNKSDMTESAVRRTDRVGVKRCWVGRGVGVERGVGVGGEDASSDDLRGDVC